MSSALPPNQALRSLPRRRDFAFVLLWLQAVQNCLGQKVIFALDEAWMCQEMFLGYHLQYAVWVYGNESLLQYDGVRIVGTEICPSDVQEKHGLLFTNINRTIMDVIDNEDILDMQGITEAVSMYYFEHGKSFTGISVAPEYQYRFEELARDAMEYYNN